MPTKLRHQAEQFELPLDSPQPTDEEIQKFLEHRDTLAANRRGIPTDMEDGGGQPLLNFSDTDTDDDDRDEFEVLAIVKGKFDFQLARDDGEISYLNFKANDVIKVLAQVRTFGSLLHIGYA